MNERGGQRQTDEERKADRTGNKPNSLWREGHSISIVERRCRLSSFITMRKAEFGP